MATYYLSNSISDLSPGTDAFDYRLSHQTESASSKSVTVNSGQTKYGYAWTDAGVPNNISWAAADIVVKVNVLSASSNVQLRITVYRVRTADGYILEGQAATSFQTLSTTGVKTFTVPMGPITPKWLPACPTDRIMVQYEFLGSVTTSSVTIEVGTSNTSVDTSIVEKHGIWHVDDYQTPGDDSWTPPSNAVTDSITFTVECIGAGQGGGIYVGGGGPTLSHGGGGGGYARSNFSVGSLSPVPFHVGAGGGNDIPGEDTWFGGAFPSEIAQGDGGGDFGFQTGGTGHGDFTHSGGDGQPDSMGATGGGGGGGAGSALKDGDDGASFLGGAGGPGAMNCYPEQGGGAGGDGGGDGQNGSPGHVSGGGGGGGGYSTGGPTNGGQGADGHITVYWFQEVQTIEPAGIASIEAFGTPTITTTGGSATISPSGITTAEAFGTSNLIEVIRPSGIVSSEAFGTTSVMGTIGPSGIASGQAFGTASIHATTTVSPSGIVSAEAFGRAQISRSIGSAIIRDTTVTRSDAHLECIQRDLAIVRKLALPFRLNFLTGIQRDVTLTRSLAYLTCRRRIIFDVPKLFTGVTGNIIG